MTETIRTVLHDQATSVGFAPVDLASVVSAGDRRRRRRTSSVVAGLAALAVIGVGGGVVATSADDSSSVAVDTPTASGLDTDGISWVRGSVLHTPDSTTDVGRTIEAYVRTSVGYVFTDGQGGVFTLDAAGVEQVGTMTDRYPRLVSDPRGDLAGWVDPSGDRPTFVLLDQATGEVTRDDSHTRPGMGLLADEADPAFIYAIDGTTVYRRDTRGAVAIDTTSGDVRLVDPDAATGFDIAGAGGGSIAFTSESGTTVGTTSDDGRLIAGLYGPPVKFSPDGRYVTGEDERLTVYDVATGDPVPLSLDRRFSLGYDWLADGTLVVIAASGLQEDTPAELLTCSVPNGTCQTAVASIGTFAELEADGASPDGEPTG